MSNQPRRLGRGLEALLGRSLEDAPAGAAAPSTNVTANVDSPAADRDKDGQLWLDVTVIDPNPNQPRKHFDEVEIADLADSMRSHGVLQPLVVRKAGERFQLIAGERRLRAAQAAGWERVPVQVREVTDQQMAELAIVENVQRKDLSALEKAESFQRYIQQYNCTQEDLAKRIHLDRSTIANLIRLLELPEAVKEMVTTNQISQGHARALLALGEEQEQIAFAKRIVSEGLSVRATEQGVQNLVHALDEDLLRLVGVEPKAGKPQLTRNEQMEMLEQQLKIALGTKVQLTQNTKGKGRLVLHFANTNEFERLQKLLLAGSPPATGEQQGQRAAA